MEEDSKIMITDFGLSRMVDTGVMVMKAPLLTPLFPILIIVGSVALTTTTTTTMKPTTTTSTTKQKQISLTRLYRPCC